jgi:hypothetical protein
MDRKGKFKVSTSLVARSQFPSLPAAKEAKQESLGKQPLVFCGQCKHLTILIDGCRDGEPSKDCGKQARPWVSPVQHRRRVMAAVAGRTRSWPIRAWTGTSDHGCCRRLRWLTEVLRGQDRIMRKSGASVPDMAVVASSSIGGGRPDWGWLWRSPDLTSSPSSELRRHGGW